ncbi:MAG: nucleotidyltransferase family protein [Planctomycetia bacterium]|nr:nucleotidyltransferase family protein [Planctomycetia bacterium]
MSKRAVILAGGKGTRLRPYTVVLPKPLMPIGDYPILEVIVRQLAYYGFTHLTMGVNHQVEIIKAFFGNGEKWNITIDYSFEDRPLSTMGPLKLIRNLPSDFLVMNGDILTDLDFNTFYEHHVSHRHLFTISSCQRKQRADYGVLEIDTANRLYGFREKPTFKYDVSMGIYMVSNKILKYIPEGQPYGFDHLMLDLIKAKIPPRIKNFDGYWLDIGRPDDYTQAIDEFQVLKDRFLK